MHAIGNSTRADATVHDHAAGYLQEFVGIQDHGPKCTSSVLISVMFFAAAWATSLAAACNRLRRAPSDQAVRNALEAMFPAMDQLETRFNRAFSAQAHQSLRKRPQSIAIDLVQIPYYGKPYEDDRELRRGEAKLGTTRFHTYATVYLVSRGQRFTLAMTYVWRDDALEDVMRRLLAKVRTMGIRVKQLLLDREFYTLDVIRALKAAHCPFLMPVVRRGRKPKDPAASQGPWRFFTWKRSGWDTHTIRRGDQKVEVSICVAVHDSTSRRGRRRRQTLVYAYGGLEPRSPAWVRQTYRERFGIESSYRQMNQSRARTTSPKPIFRLLLAGIALLLRNVWVWFHWNCLCEHLRGGGVRLHLDRLRFRTLLLSLLHHAEAFLGCQEPIDLQPCLLE